MKILIEQQAARDGFLAVLKLLGHNVLVYDPATKPAFDAFDEFSPDIYIGLDGEDRNCYRSVDKCLKEYKRTKHSFLNDGFLCAADSLLSKGSVIDPALKCDVVFVGDHKPEFDKNIRLLANQTRVKVFGRGWDIPEAVGTIAPSRLSNAISSAEIALNLEGPEMSHYLYQILISGTLCVSIPLENCPSNHVTFFKSSGELLTEVGEWLQKRNSMSLGLIGLEARKDILHSSTYFHRVATMFKTLGLEAESERTMSYYANQGL